jgi:hypothetical protein
MVMKILAKWINKLARGMEIEELGGRLLGRISASWHV